MVKKYWVYPYLIYEEPNLDKSHIKVVKLSDLKEEIEKFEKKGFHRKDKNMTSYWFTYNDMYELEKQLVKEEKPLGKASPKL